MRRLLLFSLLTLLVALLFWAVAPAQVLMNALTPALLQGRSWAFTAVQDFTSKGVKSPLKVSVDYTMANPASTLTVATNAAAGQCSSSFTYKAYFAWVNESGMTNLSTASSGVIPSGATKKLRFTRSETAPSNAKAWIPFYSYSGDGHTNKLTCVGDTNELSAVALGTTVYDCDCNGSLIHAGINETGIREQADFGVLGTAKFGVTSFAGGTVNTLTEFGRILDLSGLIPKISTDLGASYGDVLRRPLKMVTVCAAAASCDYATLTAACAAETSTSANPIDYLIGPGALSDSASCSGEDSAAIIGVGQSATTIDGGTSAPGIMLGTSKNIVVAFLTLKGNRGIDWDLSGSGGGKSYLHDLRIISDDGTAQNGDCILYGALGGSGSVAGSELFVYNTDCAYTSDGITNIDQNHNPMHSWNNTVHASVASDTNRGSAFSFFSIPCKYTSRSDVIDVSNSSTIGHSGNGLGFNGYLFEGASTGCSSGAQVDIRDAVIDMVDTSPNGKSSQLSGIQVASTATELGFLDIASSRISVNVPTDVSAGTAVGIDNARNATTVATLSGTKVRSAGGQTGTRFDLAGNVAGSILIGPDSDWLTDNAKLTGDRSRNPLVSKPASCTLGDRYMDTSGAYCICTTTGTPGTWTNTTGVGTCV